MSEGDGEGIPEDVRAAVAKLHVEVASALGEECFQEAARAAREELVKLGPYPDRVLPSPVRKERAVALYATAMAARERGRFGESVRAFERALEAAEGLYAQLRWHFLNHLAIAHDRKGDLGRAAEAYRKIVDEMGPAEEGRGVYWHALGTVLERKGDRKEAIEAYAKALQDPRRPGGDDIDSWVFNAYAGIARCGVASPAAQTGITFDWWFARGVWRQSAFVALSATAALLFLLALLSVWFESFDHAKWWMTLTGLPLLLLVLPAIRKVSLREGSLEAAEPAQAPSALPPLMANGTESTAQR